MSSSNCLARRIEGVAVGLVDAGGTVGESGSDVAVRRRFAKLREQLRRRRSFLVGILCGVVLVFASKHVVNRSTWSDRLVAPLMVSDTPGAAQAIVVMGAGVVGQCTPNLNGFRRVMLAVRLWREQRAPILLFTGGATHGSCAVATAMADLARQTGVPQDRILVETTSRTTRENGQHSAPMLRSAGVERILVVTDRLHMVRSAATFAHLGFTVERASVPIYEGHINNVDMLATGAREAAALAYYRARGWIGSELSASASNPAEGGAVAAHNVQVVSMSGVRNPDGPLVVLGASYAGGWKMTVVGDVPVINRGVSGQQSFEMLERFERDVIAARPRAVLLWGYINDIFRAQADPEDAKRRARESYLRMIEIARKHGIDVILATEVTIRAPNTWSETVSSWLGWALGREGYHDYINRHVLELNRWLIDLARQERLLVLDFQVTLGDGGSQRRREFTDADGSHITPEGYAALTAYTKPILARHFGVALGGS